MGGAGSKGLPMNAIVPADAGRREIAARTRAIRLGNKATMLETPNVLLRARYNDHVRGVQAEARAKFWQDKRNNASKAIKRVTNAARNGAQAAAGAVGKAVGTLATGVGAAGTFLTDRARNAYQAGLAKTRKAAEGLRKLSPKRRAKNFFLGKVKLTNAERALAVERKLNTNSTEFRNIIAKRRGMAAAAGNARAGPLEREGGVRGKVANLTRRAKEGIKQAAAAAGRGVVAAKNAAVAVRNAATKKASNLYAYGRNMIKYGRRRSDEERVLSARGRMRAAADAAGERIQIARNANAAAKAAAAARDEKLKVVATRLSDAAGEMGRAAGAAAAGAATRAAAAASAAFTGIRAAATAAGAAAAGAGSAVVGGLQRIGTAASTMKNKFMGHARNNATRANKGNGARNNGARNNGARNNGARNNGNKGTGAAPSANNAPKPGALRRAATQLRASAVATRKAIGQGVSASARALQKAAIGTASAIAAAGVAIGEGASAVTRSARKTGSSIARGIQIRAQAARNASKEYSASVARQKRVNAAARISLPPATVNEGNESKGNNTL